MEIHFKPEKEALLHQIASHKGYDVGDLVQEVVDSYLECEARFVEAVNLGLAAADQGEFVEPEQVWANVEKILQS